MRVYGLFLISTILIYPAQAQHNIPDFFPKIPPYEILKELIPVLEKGSIVIIQREAGKPPFITGIVLINAKPDDVLRVIKDYDKYHEFVPNVSKVKVLERFPESNSQISEYNIGFDIALGIKFTVTYTLEQNFLDNEKIIFGLPAKKGTQVFGDVRYIEKYYDTGDGRTIMVYSAYADLASFGLLSKLVYRAFPELQIPSLVAVSTLFPEAVKERIEKTKIITEPKKINYEEIKIPERIELKNILPILRLYGTVIISWYPDKNDVRFFSSFMLLPKRTVEQVKYSITDFRSWPKVFRMVEKAEPTVVDGGYKVDFRIKYKIALPIELEYTNKYWWEDGGQRLKCEIDNRSKRDIEGGMCVWDFYETKYGVVLGFTEFSDLRTGSYFLRILMDKVQGFGIGLRVALVSAYAEIIRKNI
ncbi:MAG: hypothetical protein NZ927_07870 [Candidatus Calescibacterium sp.]|nr:hypothetical protein [Candidatus Calescibacterium sp.]MCX7734904.1 hypothetical protein [bacterium]MDW8086595.1 SRPBCC family protein [Candidatus Calescibacterium sp.]